MDSWISNSSQPFNMKSSNATRDDAALHKSGNSGDSSILSNSNIYSSNPMTQRSALNGTVGSSANQMYRSTNTSPGHGQIGSYFISDKDPSNHWDLSGGNGMISNANIPQGRSSTNSLSNRMSPPLDLHRVQRARSQQQVSEYEEARLQQLKLMREKEFGGDYFAANEAARLEQQRKQMIQKKAMFPESFQQPVDPKQLQEHRRRQQYLVRRDEERMENARAARAISGRGLVYATPQHHSMMGLKDLDYVDPSRYRSMRIDIPSSNQFDYDQHYLQRSGGFRHASPRDDMRLRELHRSASNNALQANMPNHFNNGMYELEQHRLRQLRELRQKPSLMPNGKQSMYQFMQPSVYDNMSKSIHSGIPPLNIEQQHSNAMINYAMRNRPHTTTNASGVGKSPFPRLGDEVSYEYTIPPNSLILHTSTDTINSSSEKDKIKFSASPEDPIFPFSERKVKNSVSSLDGLSKESIAVTPSNSKTPSDNSFTQSNPNNTEDPVLHRFEKTGSNFAPLTTVTELPLSNGIPMSDSMTTSKYSPLRKDLNRHEEEKDETIFETSHFFSSLLISSDKSTESNKSEKADSHTDSK